MRIKDILSEVSKKLNKDEIVCSIRETPNYYACYISYKYLPKDFTIMGDFDVIILNKKTMEIERYDEVPEPLEFFPLPKEEIMNSKLIYDIKYNEIIEKSDDEIDEMFNM